MKRLKRRQFLGGLAAGGALAGVAGLGFANRAYDGLRVANACQGGPLPERLRRHPLVEQGLAGLDFSRVRDMHLHLVGEGDSGGGVWLNPDMDSWRHPIQQIQKSFFMNASCVASSEADPTRSGDRADSADLAYIRRLEEIADGFPPGFKLMPMAFDWFYDAAGRRVAESTPFFTPNDWAAGAARRRPDRFEWIASVHPYRAGAVDALERVAAQGARAVKWLPQAMGMDPASPLCDRFYDALARLGLPLLCHTGAENAVHGGGALELANPLRLRRPLARGVTVIAAHCASEGSHRDTDQAADGPTVPGWKLFDRVMGEAGPEGDFWGDISATLSFNRSRAYQEEMLGRTDWHGRLVYGSDYPLPGVVPLMRLGRFVDRGWLSDEAAEALAEIRHFNPILFDLLLKRLLRNGPDRLPAGVFENAGLFPGAVRDPAHPEA